MTLERSKVFIPGQHNNRFGGYEMKTLLLVLCFFAFLFAQEVKRPSIGRYPKDDACAVVSMLQQDGFVHIWQGVDECTQYARIKIWGLDGRAFESQLDDDSIPEVVIVSHDNPGRHSTVQIIDFNGHSYTVWQFASDGEPKVRAGLIYFAKRGPASANIKYVACRFKPKHGLEFVKDAPEPTN